jgi:hypothetical protein
MQNPSAMKTVSCFLLTILIGVTTQSSAQQNSEKQKLDYLNEIENCRKMKSAGATLTVVGAVFMIVGGSIMSGVMDGGWQPGIVISVVGIGGFCSGIPLMAVGARNEKKYNEKLQGLTVRINSTPRSDGIDVIVSVLDELSYTSKM